MNEVKSNPNYLTKYNSCRGCGSKDLLFVDSEVLCSACDWNTIIESVWSGRADKELSEASAQATGLKDAFSDFYEPAPLFPKLLVG